MLNIKLGKIRSWSDGCSSSISLRTYYTSKVDFFLFFCLLEAPPPQSLPGAHRRSQCCKGAATTKGPRVTKSPPETKSAHKDSGVRPQGLLIKTAGYRSNMRFLYRGGWAAAGRVRPSENCADEPMRRSNSPEDEEGISARRSRGWMEAPSPSKRPRGSRETPSTAQAFKNTILTYEEKQTRVQFPIRESAGCVGRPGRAWKAF